MEREEDDEEVTELTNRGKARVRKHPVFFFFFFLQEVVKALLTNGDFKAKINLWLPVYC